MLLDVELWKEIVNSAGYQSNTTFNCHNCQSFVIRTSDTTCSHKLLLEIDWKRKGNNKMSEHGTFSSHGSLIFFPCTFRCHFAVWCVDTSYANQDLYLTIAGEWGVNLDQHTNQMQIKAAQTAAHRSVLTDCICIHIGSLYWPCTELRLVVEHPGLIIFQMIVQQLSFVYCWLMLLGGKLDLAVG